MASVWVDVELDEVSTSDLLSELENRYLGKREKIELTSLLQNDEWRKLELFLKVKDKFSVGELEELFTEKAPDAPIPKEQLKLELL